MRNFGTDKPKFMSFTLDGKKKVYELPLGASLPFNLRLQYQEALAETDEMRQELLLEKFQRDFLARYMSAEVVNELPMSTIQDICQAWLEESADLGATPGE